jgi:hypothetical protein
METARHVMRGVGPEMNALSGKARTAETYLAGLGASGALIAGAIVASLLLIAAATFDVWPRAASPFGGGDAGVESVDASEPADSAAAALGSAADQVAQAEPGGSLVGGGDGAGRAGGGTGGGTGGGGGAGDGGSGTGGGGGGGGSTVGDSVGDTVNGVSNTLNNTVNGLGNTVDNTVNGVDNTVNDTVGGLLGGK